MMPHPASTCQSLLGPSRSICSSFLLSALAKKPTRNNEQRDSPFESSQTAVSTRIRTCLTLLLSNGASELLFRTLTFDEAFLSAKNWKVAQP